MHREFRERLPRYQLQRKPLVSDPGMHHGTCVMHVPWWMSGSLTRCGREKRSWYSRRMRNPQFYGSGKRPIGISNYIHVKYWDMNTHPRHNVKVVLGYGWVITSHIKWWVWLHMHASISIEPCYEKGPQMSDKRSQPMHHASVLRIFRLFSWCLLLWINYCHLQLRYSVVVTSCSSKLYFGQAIQK